MLADDWVIRIMRGRQEIGREQMVTSQRVQLLDAMAREVAENGYPGITAEAIAARAGTSSEVFHQHFQDTESCFMAAYDLGVEVLATTIEDGLGSAESPPLTRFERSLSGYLDLLATEPSCARTFLIEVWAAGPRAVQRRLEGVRRFTALITGVLNPPGGEDGLDPFACEALVGAISMLVTMRVAEDRFDQIPALREPIMGFVRRLLETAPPAGFEPVTTA
jgi:AcrR family transcriptional regulator